MRPNRKKRELANWIRRRLGSPLIDVLIDSTQIDDNIDFAVDYFGQHAGGIGNEKSLLIICTEQVKYDATGGPCDPKPTKGRWRKPVDTETCGASSVPTTSSSTTATTSSPSTGCQADLECDEIVPYNTTKPCTRYGGDDNDPNTGYNQNLDAQCLDFVTDPCCPQETEPGPGWCGDNIPDPHCFTEAGEYDEDAVGPFWVEGDTSVPPRFATGTGYTSQEGFVFKSIYDVPKDVVGITRGLGQGRGGFYAGVDGFTDAGEALFSPIHLFLNNGGLGLGSGGRFGGGFVDLVGFELGLQYIEMFRTMYSVKLDAQLLELEHKVKLSPAPRNAGIVALECYRKVPDPAMYEHIWVREYALALCMIQIGMNGNKYTGATFPGGANINAQFYLDEGKEMRNQKEEEITNGKYAEPPLFFWG